MKTLCCVFFLLQFFLFSFGQKQILPDFHADPSAHEWDGRYWIYPSTDEPGSKSWSEMKRWECFSSENLVDWKNEGQIFSLKEISWAGRAAYAPDCMKRNGKYYFYFPADYNIGVAISEHPNGPFRDVLGKPLIRNGEMGITAMDPCIFIDDDSITYLYFGGHQTVGVVKLNRDMVSRAGQVIKLELHNYDEGIWVHKRNDTYYFSYPMDTIRNGEIKQILVYCTSKSPLGPFEYQGAILDNNSRNVQHSIVQFGNNWYIFYHIEGPSPYERRVCADLLEYDEEGRIKFVKMTENGIPPNAVPSNN